MTAEASDAARALARKRWGARSRMVDHAMDRLEQTRALTPDQVLRLRLLAETLSSKEKDHGTV